MTSKPDLETGVHIISTACTRDRLLYSFWFTRV